MLSACNNALVESIGMIHPNFVLGGPVILWVPRLQHLGLRRLRLHHLRLHRRLHHHQVIHWSFPSCMHPSIRPAVQTFSPFTCTVPRGMETIPR